MSKKEFFEQLDGLTVGQGDVLFLKEIARLQRIVLRMEHERAHIERALHLAHSEIGRLQQWRTRWNGLKLFILGDRG